MSRDRQTDRRLRALIVAICAIALLMVVTTGVLAWETHKSDLRIDNANSESG
jgi:hypothetical protein